MFSNFQSCQISAALSWCVSSFHQLISVIRTWLGICLICEWCCTLHHLQQLCSPSCLWCPLETCRGVKYSQQAAEEKLPLNYTHRHIHGCILRAVRFISWSTLQWSPQTLKRTTLIPSAKKDGAILTWQFPFPLFVLSQRKIE